MSHPDFEKLTGFLYDELPEPGAAEVAQHLRHCTECREQVASWRGVLHDLPAWDVQPPARSLPMPRTTRLRTMARWAVAATVLIGVGFGLARLSAPRSAPDLAAVRAEFAREVRGELRQEITARWTDYAKEQAAREKAFQQALVQAVSRIESQQTLDRVRLRKDVETVALATREEFDRIAPPDRSGNVAPPSEP